jgi:ATP-dependent Clp protease ATP-binding subunit ClpC
MMMGNIDGEMAPGANHSKKTSLSKTPYLDQFGEDLTKLAADGKLDQIIGREKEVHRVCQILSRRKKNNPIILGDPGVGKTAIVEAIAQRIVARKVARTLLNKKIISLNLSTIVAGTKYRGEFEERMKFIVDELKANPDVIIFIDEIHTLIGAGGSSGSLDASNILKPALARGQVHCIGATTTDEYREHIEVDGALTRRFQEVFVNAPSLEESVEILMKIKDTYEDHHSVIYSDDAIDACVKMSNRYITQRELPDKAIDVMDEVGSKIHLTEVKVPLYLKKMEEDADLFLAEKMNAVHGQDYEAAARYRDLEMEKRTEILDKINEWEASIKEKKRIVTSQDVALTISEITGIPVARLDGDDAKMIIGMSKELKKLIIGQDSAVDALCRVIKRSRTGVSSGKKPIGSFMFIGPTGVGKTETVKALAEYYFGSVDNLIRIDMSEYQEKFTATRLIGAPPGFVGYEEGGQLTEAVRRKPYSVVLFDEVEKAHPDIFNTLLQVLDDGRLTDSLGRTIDFTNTIIIMTSNAGARKFSEFGAGIGFQNENMSSSALRTRMESIIQKELKAKFPPEFLNRLDETILFEQLSEDTILKIVEIELKEVTKHMEEQGILLKFSKGAKQFLVKEGYDPAYGARPLKRAIQNYVEDLLADAILEKQIVESDKVWTITYEKDATKLSLK